MEIRFLTANDASTYWHIRLQALESEPEAFGSSAEEHRALSMDEIARRISLDPKNRFVVGAFAGPAFDPRDIAGHLRAFEIGRWKA